MTAKEPLVTVLMPVKDYQGEYLRRALDSLLGQTSRNWHLLIIAEAAGRDALRQVVGRYLDDPRVDLIANEGRKLSGAFNTGMQHASAEFVAILLADDMWSSEAVAVLDQNIRSHPEVDFFHSSRIIVDERERPVSSVHRSREHVTLEDFARATPVKHLLCWRRDLALSFGGMDETLNSVGPDDFDFPWTMAEHGAVFRAIPECLYLYRDHRDGFRLTTHLPRSIQAREMRRIMRKHGLDRAEARRRVADARRTWLRQTLYRSRLDRWLTEKASIDRRGGRREVWP